MSAHGIVDQIAADWREVIDGHDPGTDWGPDAKRLVDLALEGARRIENKRALRQAKVRLWCHRLGLIPEPERPKPVLPRRIQRRVGQPLPPGAVFVGKGSKWANPLRAVLVDGRWECVGAGLSGPLPWPCNTKARADWWAVEMFRQHIRCGVKTSPVGVLLVRLVMPTFCYCWPMATCSTTPSLLAVPHDLVPSQGVRLLRPRWLHSRRLL